MEETIFDRIQEVDLQKTMETSYIDYAPTSRTENVPVSSAIRWVNIILMETARSTDPL